MKKFLRIFHPALYPCALITVPCPQSISSQISPDGALRFSSDRVGE
jgi:hypothetical protein